MWDKIHSAFEFEDGMSKELRCLNLGPTDFLVYDGQCWRDNGDYMFPERVYKLKPIDPVAWLQRNRVCQFKDAPPSVRNLGYSFKVRTMHRGFQYICDLIDEDIPFLVKSTLPHMTDCLQYYVCIYLEADVYRFFWKGSRMYASTAPSLKGFVCYQDSEGVEYDTFNPKCKWIIVKGSNRELATDSRGC